MRLLPAGEHGILVEVDSLDEAVALYVAAREAGVDARDIVPAARTVLFSGVAPGAYEQIRTLRSRPSGVRTDRQTVVTVPVDYCGPDLVDTARLLDLAPEALVQRHTSATFTVAFCGFAPGFAYCTGWDLVVPRLDSPRPRVAPGSVGLAGEFTGVYPTASPGGWRILGRTDVTLWDPAADVPALLTPGTRVRFVAT